MKIADHFFRLHRLVDLIRRKATGCPKELAQRLDVSERTVFNLLDCLRDLGAPVQYDEHKRTYLFPEDTRVELHIEVRKEDRNKIAGGENIFSHFFLDCNSVALRPVTFVPVMLH
jgi:biotin operon repressor